MSVSKIDQPLREVALTLTDRLPGVGRCFRADFRGAAWSYRYTTRGRIRRRSIGRSDTIRLFHPQIGAIGLYGWVHFVELRDGQTINIEYVVARKPLGNVHKLGTIAVIALLDRS
jgi:hypothetical protein